LCAYCFEGEEYQPKQTVRYTDSDFGMFHK